MVSTFNGMVSLSGLQTIGLDQLSGACITDSSNISSSTVAASAHALSNIAMTYLPRTGGTISGDITVSGKYHGDGSLLTGISSGGAAAASTVGVVYATSNAALLLLSCSNIDHVATSVNGLGAYLSETGNTFNNVGKTSNTSLLASDIGGSLIISGGSRLVLQSGNRVEITALDVYSGFSINQYSPITHGFIPVLTSTYYQAGGNTNTWMPVLNCTNTQATFQNLYYTADFAQSSDASLKTNVNTFDDGAINIINQLRPVNFQWNNKMNELTGNSNVIASNRINHGFIAQEVALVLPDLVEDMDISGNTIKSIKPLALIPYLVKAVQELSAQNQNLAQLISLMPI